MRLITLLAFVCLFPHLLSAQDRYFLIWDDNASSFASAENLLTVHRMAYEFEDTLIRRSYWKEDTRGKKMAGMGYRLAKSVLLDVQVDLLIHFWQRLVFGHGFRYREFGLENNAYTIELFPPYGGADGIAVRGNIPGKREFGIHEEAVINMGAMSSASMMATTLRDKWLLRGDIHYRETLLFLSTHHDYTAYILSNQLFAPNEIGNFVLTYLEGINGRYGFDTEETYQLTLNDLSSRVSVNFLNIYQFFAIYAYLKTYLYDGQDTAPLPMLQVGAYQWLPSIRFGLTPFGSEYFIENHVVREGDLYELSLRLGDGKLDRFWGLGARWRHPLGPRLSLEPRIDIWDQPSLSLGGDIVRDTDGGFGGRFLGAVDYQFGEAVPLGLHAQVGFKTAGFIPGEQLDEGLIVRVGLMMVR